MVIYTCRAAETQYYSDVKLHSEQQLLKVYVKYTPQV